MAAAAAADKDPDILGGGGHDSAANLADLGLQVGAAWGWPWAVRARCRDSSPACRLTPWLCAPPTRPDLRALPPSLRFFQAKDEASDEEDVPMEDI